MSIAEFLNLIVVVDPFSLDFILSKISFESLKFVNANLDGVPQSF